MATREEVKVLQDQVVRLTDQLHALEASQTPSVGPNRLPAQDTTQDEVKDVDSSSNLEGDGRHSLLPVGVRTREEKVRWE